MHKEAEIREPLILGDKSYHDITEDVCRPIESKAPKPWYIMITIAGIVGLWGIGCILYLLGTGIGVWGLNNSVDWAWDITNFVWWVGIGHAGTLISAVLLLFRQKWRMAINRSAEAMTIFAVFMAAIFPGIHMGRIWVAYWVLPMPNQFGSLWVNFNSPLLWDVFAISTYLSVSLVFWYIGLIPDFATIRDRIKAPMAKKFYSILSFGWSGRAKHWNRFEIVSLVLAGLATPLVFSVHSIVSFDFATSVIPGWHTTIFPPYFVSGAVFSGFAMVQTLLLIMRKALHLENYIHTKHIEYMNIVIIVTGSIVGVAYITELFISWYSGVEYESYAFINRATGDLSWSYWIMMTCNVISPQLYWFKKLRTNLSFTFFMSIVINIGMWFERFVIIVTSLHRGHLPATWTMFYPTWVDIGIFLGTLGIFFTLFLLFARYFPVLALNEVKTILKSSGQNYKESFGHGAGFWDAHSHDHGHDHDGVTGHAVLTNKEPLVSDHESEQNDVVSEPTPPAPEPDKGETISDIKENLEFEKPEEVRPDEVQPEAEQPQTPGLTPEEIEEYKLRIMKNVGTAHVDQSDDLKKINGIDAVLEGKLNIIGIFTYEQVSKLTKDDYDLIDAMAGSVPGRAEGEDWAGQAKQLMNDNSGNE